MRGLADPGGAALLCRKSAKLWSHTASPYDVPSMKSGTIGARARTLIQEVGHARESPIPRRRRRTVPVPCDRRWRRDSPPRGEAGGEARGDSPCGCPRNGCCSCGPRCPRGGVRACATRGESRAGSGPRCGRTSASRRISPAVGSLRRASGSVNGFYGTGGSPLLGVSAEYGVNENFSVGGVLGHASSKDTYVVLGETFETKYGYTIIAARGSYHLTDLVDNERLDLYAGASLGYNKVSVTESARGYGDYVSVGASYMLYGVHAGARYWFNDKVAGFG
ncbi:MAG: porin family protein [Candidatus Eisenbacteria bacterium]|nr:porin family protein [Candidatus Eisenbacteria bacterium]